MKKIYVLLMVLVFVSCGNGNSDRYEFTIEFGTSHFYTNEINEINNNLNHYSFYDEEEDEDVVIFRKTVITDKRSEWLIEHYDQDGNSIFYHSINPVTLRGGICEFTDKESGNFVTINGPVVIEKYP